MKAPQIVAGPSAGASLSPGIFLMNFATDASFAIPITLS
jgi:hypothetical protein